MRGRLIAIAALFAAGCFVDLLDPYGRACDHLHPCAGGRICLDGWCVVPVEGDAGGGTGVDAGDAGGGEIDAGPDAGDGGCEVGQCTVGVGGCARTGPRICLPDGGTRCEATPGMPSPEVCGDGIDNDCDGRRDVAREVVLVPPDGGFDGVEQLAWTFLQNGYSAVYAMTVNGISRVYFQRFDAQLSPAGPPLPLWPQDSKESSAPAILPIRPDVAAVAWADQSLTNAPRIVVAAVNEAGAFVPQPLPDGGTTRYRIFSPQDARGGPRLALANDNQFLLVTWVNLQERVSAAVIGQTGTVRGPQLVPLPSLPDGGPMRVTEVHAAPVGNNDFMLALTSMEGATGVTRYQRIQETLTLNGPLIEQSVQGTVGNARAVRVPPPSGNTSALVAGAWVTTRAGQVSIMGTSSVTDGGVMRVAGPAAGSWAMDAVWSPRGTLVGWIQAENNRLFARLIGGSTVVDLTAATAGRTYKIGADPSLAVSDAGFVAMGYAVTRVGMPITLHGQLFCAP